MKSCPFCGGNVAIEKCGISCESCDYEMIFGTETNDFEMVKVWNTRYGNETGWNSQILKTAAVMLLGMIIALTVDFAWEYSAGYAQPNPIMALTEKVRIAMGY